MAPTQMKTSLQWWWPRGWEAAAHAMALSLRLPQTNLLPAVVVEAGPETVLPYGCTSTLLSGRRALGPDGVHLSLEVLHTSSSCLESAEDIN